MSDEKRKAYFQPKRLKLRKGETYYWCACGESTTQPFCDSAHKHGGTALAPLGFEVEEDRDALLCTCKQSLTPPFCDTSHRKIG